MNVAVSTLLKHSLSAATLMVIIAQPAIASWEGGSASKVNSGDNILGLNETIKNTAANAAPVGWTGNDGLYFDAWGHEGAWLTFNLTSASDTVVTATAQTPGAIAPAFTIYRAYQNWVGTTPVPGAPSGGDNGTIHDFNQVAQANQNGFKWATAQVANGLGVVETLGYANSGNSYTTDETMFAQEINRGAYDISIDDQYESGVTGSIGEGVAQLQLKHLAAGWYTVFVSGASDSYIGGPIDVTVSSVPVPSAVWLFGSSFIGLIGVARKKQIV